MERTDPHAGIPGMLAVRFTHVVPSSRVSCSCPSLVPAQMTPFWRGDSAIPYTTPAYSTPMLSGVSPPELFMRLRSLRVRSGLITCQLCPPSRVRCTCWLPVYSVWWSCGEMSNGASHTKRYFCSSAGPLACCGHTSTCRNCRRFSSKRTTIPPTIPLPDAVL